VQLSFMGESRRLDNRRIKRELGARLLYPRVEQAVAAMAVADSPMKKPAR
jgi:hypothetical protein